MYCSGGVACAIHGKKVVPIPQEIAGCSSRAFPGIIKTNYLVDKGRLPELFRVGLEPIGF
jgi:hypothetical protein